jgi:LacI family transcriptional regulator
MAVNIHEIARRANVSVATVSRALNKNGKVNEHTRQKVLQIANEFNYKPSSIARGLSKSRTDTIGVILPGLAGEFFMDILQGIDEEAYRNNRYVMVSSSHSKRNIVETLLEFMASGRVDGVILMAPQMNTELIDLIKKSKRPIVLLNASADVVPSVSFNINNYQGAYGMIQHLIRHGFKNIAMILGPEGNYDAEERFRGYKGALKDHDMPFHSELVVGGDFSPRSGYYGCMRLMSASQKPDAIFTANDMMAVGVYQAVRDSNLSIPRDIAVAGFDDIYLSRIMSPRLTTVHVPIIELGNKAVKYVLTMINGQVNPNEPYREEVSTGLVIGGSCGCSNFSGQSIF